jgi:uncharacterized protein
VNESSSRTSADQARVLTVQEGVSVSARLLHPPGARACYVLAHGAGAGMDHPGVRNVAEELAKRGVASLRYQFPYMERRSRRPDPAPLCHATVRAAAAAAAAWAPGLALFAGGRSFGGRMTSQAQAERPLPEVRGLAFLAFPLHPAGRPSDTRAQHLTALQVPMLFLQGTRDALAECALLQQVVSRLGSQATLHLFDDADHSFHVRASSGRTDVEVRSAMIDILSAWMAQLS